jgi:hypothetical protein
MRTMGFTEKWITLIMTCVKSVSYFCVGQWSFIWEDHPLPQAEIRRSVVTISLFDCSGGVEFFTF